MKIFIIGFNKTGTRSLHKFFEDNEISSIYWNKGKLAQNMTANYNLNKKLLSNYEHIRVFSDMEYIDPITLNYLICLA